MKKNRRIIIVLVILSIILLVGFGYISSYFGYQGYNKGVYRRFSETIEESKNRKVFVKRVNYKCSTDSIKIMDVFMEKGYRWGNSASKQTRFLQSNDTLMSNTPQLPFQVVVSFKKNQSFGKVSVFSGGDYNKYSPFIPIKADKIKDTLVFYLILKNEPIGTLKAW